MSFGLKNLFTKKKEIPAILSPYGGTLMALEETPDEAFSQKMLGEGFSVDPDRGEAVSPCDGTVSCVFDTGHAIGITGEDGNEYLLHVGIDTVNMGGEGFEPLVKEEEKVKAGQPVLRFDLDLVKAKAPSPVCVLAIGNSTENGVLTLAEKSGSHILPGAKAAYYDRKDEEA